MWRVFSLWIKSIWSWFWSSTTLNIAIKQKKVQNYSSWVNVKNMCEWQVTHLSNFIHLSNCTAIVFFFFNNKFGVSCNMHIMISLCFLFYNCKHSKSNSWMVDANNGSLSDISWESSSIKSEHKISLPSSTPSAIEMEFWAFIQILKKKQIVPNLNTYIWWFWFQCHAFFSCAGPKNLHAF